MSKDVRIETCFEIVQAFVGKKTVTYLNLYLFLEIGHYTPG